ARDHTDNFSTPFKCSVRKGTHQSDPSAAVDDRDFLRNKLRRKRDSTTCVAWAAADTGATENTETFPHIGVERPLVRLISKPDKLFQLREGGSGINRFYRERNRARQMLRFSCCHQRRRRIHEHNIAPRGLLSFKNSSY